MEYYDDYRNNSQDYGYNDSYKWNYGVDYFGGKNYGNYNLGRYRRERGYGQARYGPPCYGQVWPGAVPPEVWGHSFGSDGPPFHQREEKPSSIWLRGVRPTQPKELLNVMGHDGCGLCGIVFNSADMYWIHNISKGHQRLQQKWLTQQVDVGSRRLKEVRLRSRHLYCELCDVHITSKVQADSHYAGKSHRAVVLGQKPPRNRFLLQNNVKGRLDQLIRREKKILKFVKEEEEKEIPIVKPELYCKLCKSRSTCSEQMIMHLNGKRHLSKEKSYILSMMNAGKLVNEEPVDENNKTAVESWDC